ncbi:hypothetical protein AMK59_5410, partial [Oryctes borbonicus]
FLIVLCVLMDIMCSTSPCGKKKIEFQKVVIPRGMINPHETTVIEIPINLQKQPVVVAKRKTEISRANNKSRFGSRSKYDSFRPKQTSSPISIHDQHQTSRSFMNYTPLEGLSSIGDLEATERQERDQLQRDLDEFQRARRKLLANTSHLVNGEESSRPSVRSFRSKHY